MEDASGGRITLNLVRPQFREAIESLAEGFAICSPVRNSGIIIDFLVLYANIAFARMTHVDKEEIEDKRMSGVIPEFFDNFIFRSCMDAFESYEPIIIPSMHFKKPDGKHAFEGYFDITITRCLNGIAVTMNDVTERKRSELQLMNTLKELERSNMELEQFAYIASHDLQEPLRMVSNFTKMLELKYKDKLDSKADEFIWQIIDGAKRMSALIHDLLTFSRISTRSQPLAKIDLNDVLENVLNDLSVIISETKAVIIPDVLPFVLADSTQMKQLFQNLIQNALKFCDKQNPVISITAKKKMVSGYFV